MESPTVVARVSSQFSLLNIWNRLGRLVVVALGAVVTLGRMPGNVVEWAGFGLSLAWAIWTGESEN